MKLLLDENLSDRIVDKIIDLYPDSQHVKTLGDSIRYSC
jgi:predicted nuclease of predicted toxin-antitoxin system